MSDCVFYYLYIIYHIILFMYIYYTKIQLLTIVFISVNQQSNQLINGNLMENELFKLSWLDWLTSWEASKKKTSKTNRWIIIVTDYQIWPAKLFWVCNHFGRQANIFDKSISEFPTSVPLKHKITKQSFNQYQWWRWQ